MKKRAKLDNKNSKFVKSLSVAALAGLTFFGAQANAQDTDLIEVYQTAGDREYNFESADDVYTVQSSLGVMGEGSFTVNGVLADDGTKSTIDLNDKDGFKVSDIDKFSAGNLEIKNAISTDGLGGAIRFEGGTQELGDNIEVNNNQSAYGGAIYNLSKLTVGDNATFSENIAREGAAIFSNSYEINFGKNLYVNNNHAIGETNSTTQTDINAGVGGGFFFTGRANQRIGDNALFENNTAKHYGGAIYAATGGAMYIGDNAVFKNNSANDGSAIYATDFLGLISIGDNALFESNNVNSGGIIHAEKMHALEIGDNLTLKNNNGTGIYTKNVDVLTIGDNFNYNYNNSSAIYASINDTNGVKTFSIGDNANITNNNGGSNLIYAIDYNINEIGDNFKFNNNRGNVQFLLANKNNITKTITIGNNN